MKTKSLRIEQKEANMDLVDEQINSILEELENNDHEIIDIRLAVGRDADTSSGLDKKFSITVLIMYE